MCWCRLAPFFSAEAIGTLVKLLIGQLLVVHDRDMEEWVHDPEGYFHSLDEKMNWEDDLRSCADQFLTTLLEQHRAAAMPVVVEMMQETLEVVLKTDSQALQVPTAPLRRRAAASVAQRFRAPRAAS